MFNANSEKQTEVIGDTGGYWVAIVFDLYRTMSGQIFSGGATEKILRHGRS